MTTVLPPSDDNCDAYTFLSRPRALNQKRKYRAGVPPPHCEPPCFGNIMYDKRVVRGTTYGQHMLPLSANPDPIEIQRQQESQRRAIARRRAKAQLRPATPEPVIGRQHSEIQTELYLEELSDRIEEVDMHTQTDAFLDKPSTPLFIPAKSGKDIATQIQEGELFDFDVEVSPMLEVLVGKTIEQALLEVMEEEELTNLRALQRDFEELRNAELAEVQRMEEKERRHREEKKRRIEQQQAVLMKEKESAEKIAARAFAQQYLADLVPAVFTTLRDNGFFYDHVERDVEKEFLPWLMKQVQHSMGQEILGRTILDMVIREIMKTRKVNFKPVQVDQPVQA
ncbi:radial spoke head protein 3 homolog [Callorhinchus milii]|uniref:Radial spoke 3-like protein n=1 Tax=Callorhinchus milii TaxID=7868 RepID=V9KKI3_CALMI|nr:radial spoke head protein 3 homolog [Callorhinchus milii]|eukprot:gi/632952843/ref/XP_007892078.1/ PREDICTED: radial spoke head protein 3 homolog [Callorhinchus milii]